MKHSIEVKNKIEKSVVVKTNISSQLKLKFRILCIQQETTMSLMIERLVRSCLAQDKLICDRASSYPKSNLEVISIYIPASVKMQLKILCMQQRVSMKMVLSQLIEEWVVANA